MVMDILSNKVTGLHIKLGTNSDYCRQPILHKGVVAVT